MKKADIALLAIFASFILIFGSLIFILPQKDFSESENRYLAQMPTFSLSSLLNGEYTRALSSFYTDQFPLRGFATTTYALSERSMGKKNVGGVICDENRLIALSTKKTADNANFEASILFASVVVDSKYSLYKEKSEALSLYYNTDHHRTTLGAYYLYLEACEALKITPYPESYFEKQIVCEDFYGTTFFKSRLPKFTCKPDTIELWRYESDDSVKLTIHDTGEIFYGFYDFSKLETTDKYAVFLGGNYAHASVTTSDKNDEKPTLLLFKDSFANAVVPFLALHFNIDLVDPRYATKGQLSTFYNDSDYDYRLFIGCPESFN